MEQQQFENAHAQSHYHKGGSRIVWGNLFLFSSLIITAVLRVCVWDCSVAFVYFPSLFPPLAASLCASASHCLPSDVIAPVQNRRRLGIW